MNRKVVAIGFGLEPKYVERLRQNFPEVDIRVSGSKGEMMEIARDAEVFFGWPNDAIVEAGKQIRWLHLLGAGADGFSAAPVRERGILVTNSRGVGAPNIAEHVLAMMFSFARGLPALGRAQREQTWTKGHHLRLFELDGQTIGIIGLGAIGQALAAKAAALGMRVLGARQSGRPVAGVEHVYGIDELPRLAAEVDHLVGCVPGTPDSTGLIDGKVFNAMKPGGYFYNVGRGATVVTDDLLAAMEQGIVAGAGLDVVDTEPLPAGHPLWDHPGVILTAHTAGNTPRYWERGIVLFEDNLRRYLAGETLGNQVDLAKGY